MRSQPQHEKKYRRDIDALRAIAVLSVVIYHFSKDWLPGGFVGVDVFFVISGFLISSILIPSIAEQRFSFSDFYLRRIRRIIPATLFCVGVTVAVCSAFYTPTDGLLVAKSGLAALFSVSNLYFLQGIRTDYFAPTSDTLPLLHTWSLGVEEQFYLIWPLLIFVLAKMKRLGWLWLCTTLLTLWSFALSEYYLKLNPSFSYYMLPARAGELLVGTLAYLLSTQLKKLPLAIYHLASVFGLGLIIYASITFDKSMNFPGWSALIPTFGAALFILAGTHEKNRINAGLAIQPVVFVGLISFSLYLWHWPVLAFMRYVYAEMNPQLAVISLLLIVMLTLFSYFAVEKPFRNPTQLKKSYWLIGMVFTGIVALSVWVIQQQGTLQVQGAQRFNAQLQQLAPNSLPANAYTFNCQMAVFDEQVFDQQRCKIGTAPSPHFLLIGDSNAAHYVGYLKEIAETRGGSFQNYTHSACAPFAENVIGTYAAANQVTSCQSYNRKIRAVAAQYKTLFIGGSWNNYLTLAGEQQFRQDLANMLRDFSQSGQQVILASKVPVFPTYDLQCQEKSIRMPFIQCGKREGYPFKAEQKANQILVELAAHYPNVQVLSLRERICSNGFCSPYLHNKPLYFDANHLSMEGSILIAEADLRDHRVPAYLLQALVHP